jgi:hypothetical protein
MGTQLETQLRSGYYRDADCMMYVTEAGMVYWVQDPETDKPAWEECGFLSSDAEPTTLCAEDREVFERTRIAYEIPA